MKTILTAILFGFLHMGALAQPEKSVYSVINVLDEKKSRLELWSLNVPKGEGIHHELTKEPFDKKSPPFEKQVQRRYFKEIYQAGQPTYLREKLTEDPNEMWGGQRSYGYIEERDVKTHHVVRSSPIFYKVEEVEGWKRATFKIYLPNGNEEVIIKDFLENFYHLPFHESRIIIQRGIVVSHLIYVYERK